MGSSVSTCADSGGACGRAQAARKRRPQEKSSRRPLGRIGGGSSELSVDAFRQSRIEADATTRVNPISFVFFCLTCPPLAMNITRIGSRAVQDNGDLAPTE